MCDVTQGIRPALQEFSCPRVCMLPPGTRVLSKIHTNAKKSRPWFVHKTARQEQLGDK